MPQWKTFTLFVSMGKTLFTYLLSVFFIVGSLTASTQQGLFEARLALKASNVDGDNSESDSEVQFDVTLGYFVTEAVSISAAISGGGDSSSLISSAYTVGVDYHFGASSNLVPYLGAEVGYGESEESTFIVDEEDDGFLWEIHGGLKQFLNENVAIVYELHLGQTEGAEFYGGSIGVSVFLGRR